ncbi:MAG: UDP-3-O-(3-hydroxymyristoyl)glucosamine N-acyltransferase [Legionella sp.]|nr:UDP-3-O-(3-hydroxymyristoyl)glucosamine N-acyltransferase [Legionella sp.]
MNVSLHEIATLVQGTLSGNPDTQILSLAPIDKIVEGALVFATDDKHFQHAECSSAAAIIAPLHMRSKNKPTINVPDPFETFMQVINHFYAPKPPCAGIHATAVIAKDAVLGENVSIGPYVIVESGAEIGANTVLKSHVYVGENVKVGANTVLHPHVTIYANCFLGERVAIHASSVIGSDGFGYTQKEGAHHKIPHIGAVIIGNDVEIGANTVIDRATLGATQIGEGTKIDNLVQVAHSVKLGKHNILCAFTGVAGSTTSGDHVIFAANVGVSDHVRIDDHVILGARAGVPPKKHLKQGQLYLGNPARPRDKALEQELSTTRIPFMRKQLKNLSQKVNELSEKLTNLCAEE